MRHPAIAAAALVAALALGCASSPPSAAEFAAAQQIVAAADAGEAVDPGDLLLARSIIHEYGEPGVDWLALAGGAATALLGVPMLGGRGRSLIAAGIGALASGDARGVIRAAASYTGARHSGDVLED